MLLLCGLSVLFAFTLQGAFMCVDSTFATPVNSRALQHGADLVLHSATKCVSVSGCSACCGALHAVCLLLYGLDPCKPYLWPLIRVMCSPHPTAL